MELLIGSIFLVVVGLVMALFPAFIYELVESWKNSSADTPSKLYKFHIRFGGVVCTLVGIAGLIVHFIL